MERGANESRRMVLLVICYLGFISLGLPDTLIGVAWPSVREHFGLEQSQIAWIFIGAGFSYFISSFFAGRLLKLLTVGTLLGISTALVSLSGLNYALAQAWPFFVLGSLFHGLGSGAIDAGLNHYVASHFSARHMNWLHAFYSVGAMFGPIIMTLVITRAQSWRLGYLSVAVALAGLSLLFLLTRSLWVDRGEPVQQGEVPEERPPEISAGAALKHRVVWLHIFLFFIYTGLEISIGQWSFTILTESRGVPVATAGIWVTIYWASILAGRIIVGFVVDRFGIDRLIRWSTVFAVAGTALFAWNPVAYAAPVALGAAGLGLAVIFPCLMTRTPQRFGKGVAAHAIGFQVGAAMLGSAALPSAMGAIAASIGLHYIASVILALAVLLLALHEWVLASGSRRVNPL